MESFTSNTDQVVVKGILFEAVVGLDAWHRPGKAQPVELEVRLAPSGGLEAAAREDSVAYTIDYGKLYKSLRAGVFNGNFESVTNLYQTIRTCLPEVVSWQISLNLPKAILTAKHGLQCIWTGSTDDTGITSVMQVLVIRDIECRCIIGVNSHERLEKQQLRITVSVVGVENRLSPSMLAGVNLNPAPGLVYQEMVQEVVEVSFFACLNMLIDLTHLASRRLEL